MFTIKIAGIAIGINCRYDYTKKFCREYTTSLKPDFTVSVTDEEIKKEQFGGKFSEGYCECICIYRHICREIVDYDAFLMHSAVISVDGEGYAFAAKSGTGKSTHINQWLKAFGERTEIINGDKPILRFEGDVLKVCGTPWQGKECLGCNKSVPLKAICFIERGKTNSICRLSDAQVSERLFHQVLMPESMERLSRFMDMLDKMVRNIPCYLLKCNISEEAAITAYNGMKGN